MQRDTQAGSKFSLVHGSVPSVPKYLRVANWKIPVAAITLKNGIVTKHYVPTLSTTESVRHLTDSQWQADAAMSSFACGDILYWAKPIFDFLIKSKYFWADL